jgi:hypothetical protein
MPQLICPLCHETLLQNAQQHNSEHEEVQHSNPVWRCINKHSFDLAREGYLNLHLVQHKKSKDPGDNPEMVKARRSFLHAEYYHPLRDAVVELLTPLQVTSLLDIGCGEGYYTSRFRLLMDWILLSPLFNLRLNDLKILHGWWAAARCYRLPVARWIL